MNFSINILLIYQFEAIQTKHRCHTMFSKNQYLAATSKVCFYKRLMFTDVRLEGYFAIIFMSSFFRDYYIITWFSLLYITTLQVILCMVY